MSGTKKTTKRGFAVLDREKALKSAVGAISILRALSKFETTFAAWRSGTGYALELVEGELNDILLFSSSDHLPDELFGKAQPVPDDLSEAGKAAAKAVKVLRKILKEARSDLGVEVHQCDHLDAAIDRLEVALNNMLPPPGAPPTPKLPGLSDGEAPELGSEGNGRVDSAGSVEERGGAIMSKRVYSVHLVATRLCEGWVDVAAETEQEALELAQTSPNMAKVDWELVDYLDYKADDCQCSAQTVSD